jgi:hypothetical protein
MKKYALLTGLLVLTLALTLVHPPVRWYPFPVFPI